MTEWTKEMMDAEVIECARYGDADDLRALLSDGADVNSMDASGTTAMHMAAANGQIECLEILQSHNAAYKTNQGGNSPLHWAVQNGQLLAFQFLCANYQVDVLAKNALGRSSLTEAFTRGEETVLEACLSHPSSSEDKLMATSGENEKIIMEIDESDNGEKEAAATSATGETVFSAVAAAASLDKSSNMQVSASDSTDASYDTNNSITHVMNLLPADRRGVANSANLNVKPLFVRELPISRADNPFGSETAPEDDTTGLGLWPATVLCANWVAQDANLALIKDQVVVELGAGCGLPGLAAAFYGQARSVYITDIHEPTLKNAIYNIHLNSDANMNDKEGQLSPDGPLPADCVITGTSEPTAVHVLNVSWTDSSTFPTEKARVVLGSDLVYDKAILGILGPAVYEMLETGGTFLYVAPDEFRDGMAELVQTLESQNLRCTSRIACADEMYCNPLMQPTRRAAAQGADKAGDVGDDFVLHFYDLARRQPHTLYTFVKV